jgi:hypothetical protein
MTNFLLDNEDQDDEIRDGFFARIKSNHKFLFFLILAFILGGSTLASNFSIGGGRIEYGQGLFKVAACDSWISIGLYPTAATYGGYSRVQSVELIGLNPVSCANKVLRFKFYGTGPSPLDMYFGITGTDTNTATATTGNANTLSVYDTSTTTYTGTYAAYAGKALTVIDQSGANIGYSDQYLSISYLKSTGSWKIYMFQPLCLMRDVTRVTVESAPLVP